MIDKETALSQMDSLAKRLNEIELERRDLQLAYWRWQAQAYPVYECHHPATHFCKNCFDQAVGARG